MLSYQEARKLLEYDPETGILTRRKTGKPIGSPSNGYLVASIGGEQNLVHRLVWLWVHGELPPKGTVIDHINRQKSDNRLSNLRTATRRENWENQGQGGAATVSQRRLDLVRRLSIKSESLLWLQSRGIRL